MIVADVQFSLSHLFHLFSPNPLRGEGIISMVSRGTRTLMDSEDDHDKGWLDRFIAFPTQELILLE